MSKPNEYTDNFKSNFGIIASTASKRKGAKNQMDI